MKLALLQVCALVCLAAPAGLLFGQQTTGNGSVTGRVTDASGGVIPDATVTLTDRSTNIPITTQTNSAGLYVFNNVTRVATISL